MSALLIVTILGAAPLVLRDVTVVDVESGRLRPDTTVVVEGDRIARLGPSASVATPAGARVVEGKGRFLIPGLWDMHVHLEFGDWFPGGREISLPLFLANGVTGVRDMGGELETLLRWRKESTEGSLPGPRLVLSGPMLDGPKPRFPSSVAVATPDDGRRAVRDVTKRGADFVKLQSLIPREAVLAIADEAKKAGIAFAGHVPDAVRASEASEAGQKSFEHLIGVFEGSSWLHMTDKVLGACKRTRPGTPRDTSGREPLRSRLARDRTRGSPPRPRPRDLARSRSCARSAPPTRP
jgi:imidazolonepropionase-like amidohydrolase